jgi:hypothetical protein
MKWKSCSLKELVENIDRLDTVERELDDLSEELKTLRSKDIDSVNEAVLLRSGQIIVLGVISGEGRHDSDSACIYWGKP